jgi:RNA polymerase sigma factor (sigma-70 family)
MSIDQSSLPPVVPASVSPEQRFLNFAHLGDKGIIQSLVREYADRSYNLARRIIGRDEGAEDAVQDAYVLLVRTAKRYDGSVPFAAWLGRLVISSAANYRRRMHRHKNLTDLSDQGVAAMNDHAASAAGEAIQPEVEALRTALDSLPDHYRTPLTLHYFGGLNREETAQALGTPVATIAKQLARGLERLRDKLGRAGFAVTSAGVLTIFSSIPTYAAPPTLMASLTSVASERLLSMGGHISGHFLSAKTLTLGKVAGLAIAALVPAAMLVVLLKNDPSSQATPNSSIPELIAHWSFDEGQGTTVKSKVGNGDVCTLVNGPVWIKGETGGRLSFDGIDDFVQVEHRDGLNSDSLTVSLRFMAFEQMDRGTVLIQKMEWRDSNGWVLSLDTSRDLKLKWETTKNGTYYSATSTTVIQENTLYAVVGTYSEGVLKLYINGALEATVAGAAMGVTGDPLYMGCEDGCRPGEVPHMLHGCLEDVRIYNGALSDSEITSLSH